MHVRNAALAGAFAAFATTALPAHADTATCPTTGAKAPGDLQRQWILEGWEYKPGDKAFDFKEKLGRFYDWSSPDVRLFDDFDPDRRLARSAADYGAIWQPLFRGNRSAHHAVSDAPDVVTGTGDLAASTMEFTARIETLKGQVTGIRTRSDLVWRCQADGWKIIREHNSSKIIPVADAERVLAESDAKTR